MWGWKKEGCRGTDSGKREEMAWREKERKSVNENGVWVNVVMDVAAKVCGC